MFGDCRISTTQGVENSHKHLKAVEAFYTHEYVWINFPDKLERRNKHAVVRSVFSKVYTCSQ